METFRNSIGAFGGGGGGGGGSNASSSDASKVNVAIRVRPLIDREKESGAQIMWKVENNELRQLGGHADRLDTNVYPYDTVFDPETKNKDVYDAVVAPIVNKSLEGFNGTILCYGQTSSGKTHTLYGSSDDKGIILLFADHLFDRITMDEGKRSYIIKVALLEIYNEKVTDLLDAENHVELVEIDGYFVPKKLVEITVVNSTGIREAADRIQRQRKVGETNMNKDSSRSHTILRVAIIATACEDAESHSDFGSGAKSPRATTAVLHFVDLAGSEKQAQTGASGERFQEARSINKSLSVLSHVISQLSSQSQPVPNPDNKVSGAICTNQRTAPKSRFINFRDSNLTRLLKSTLSGEAFTSMICNITLASLDETKSTLTFAKLAKKIQIQPKQNFCINNKDAKELEEYCKQKDQELKAMQRQLELMKEITYEKSKFPVAPSSERRHSLCPGILTRTTEFRVPYLPRKSSAMENYKSAEQTLKELGKQTFSSKLKIFESNGNTRDQEVQTEMRTPEKPKRFKGSHNTTPIYTLRVSDALLRDSIENDVKEWLEEKSFLEKEREMLKQELEEVVKKTNLEKQELENDVIKQMEACDKKIKRREMELREELGNRHHESIEDIQTKEKLLAEKEELKASILRLEEELKSKDQLQKDISSENEEKLKEELALKESLMSEKQNEFESMLRYFKVQLEALETQLAKEQATRQKLLAEKDAEINNMTLNENRLKEELDAVRMEEKPICVNQSTECDLSSGLEEERDMLKQELEETVKKAELEKQELEETVKKSELEKQGLEETVKKFEVEKQEMEEAVKKSELEKQGLEETVKKFEIEKQQIEETVKKVESEKQVLEETLRNAELEKQEIEKIVNKTNLEKQELENDVIKQVEACDSKIKEREMEVEQMAAKHRELIEDIETKEKLLADYEAEKEELKANLLRLEEVLKAKDQLKVDISSEYEKLKEGLALKDSQLLEKQNELESVIRNLKVQHEELEAQLTDEQATRQKLLAEKDAEINILAQNEHRLKEELDAARKEEKPITVNQSTDCDLTTDILEEMAAKHRELTEDIQTKEKLLADNEAEREELKANLLRLDAELKSKDQFQKDTSSENKKLQEEFELKESLLLEKQNEFENMLRNLKAQHEALEAQLAEEQATKQKLLVEKDAEINILAQKENRLKEELDAARNIEKPICVNQSTECDFTSAYLEEKSFLEKELEMVKQQLEDTVKKFEIEKQEFENEVTQKMEACDEKIKQQEMEIEKMAAKHLAITEDVHAKEKLLADSKAEKEELQANLLRLEDEIQSKHQLQMESSSEIEKLKEALVLKESLLSDKQNEFESMLRDMKVQLEALEAQLAEEVATRQKVLAEKEELKANFLRLEEELKSKDQILNGSSSENGKLKEELALKESLMSEKQNEFESILRNLKVQHEALETQFAEKQATWQKLLTEKDAEIYNMAQNENRLREEFDAARKKGKPISVNRSTECDFTSDFLDDMRRRSDFYKNQAIAMKRDLKKCKQSHEEELAALANSRAELERQLSTQTRLLRQFEASVAKESREREVQCNLMKELVDRSERGEKGLLPSYIPDVAQLRHDLKCAKNRMDALQIHVNRCTCAQSNLKTFGHRPTIAPKMGQEPIKGFYNKPAGLSLPTCPSFVKPLPLDRVVGPLKLKQTKFETQQAPAPIPRAQEKVVSSVASLPVSPPVNRDPEDVENVPTDSAADTSDSEWADELMRLISQRKMATKPSGGLPSEQKESLAPPPSAIKQSTSSMATATVSIMASETTNVVSSESVAPYEETEDDDDEPVWMMIDRLNQQAKLKREQK